MSTLLWEKTLKRALVRQASITPGHRVLDLGCGTATLTMMMKHAEPKAEVVGADGDEQILAIARAKVARAGIEIQLDQGMAYALPYPDSSFDRVVSSLVIHHLTPETVAGENSVVAVIITDSAQESAKSGSESAHQDLVLCSKRPSLGSQNNRFSLPNHRPRYFRVLPP